MKFLDGKKSFLFVVAFVISGVVNVITGQDVTGLLDSLFHSMKWEDPALIEDAKATATLFVPLALATWAAVSAARKMYRQYKAGANLGEIGAPIGVVKAAIADGKLEVVAQHPVVLKMEEVPMVAQPAEKAPAAERIPLGW